MVLKRLTECKDNLSDVADPTEKRNKGIVGVVVSGGAEAAVRITRRLLTNLPDNHVTIKLDFSSAFSSVREETILTTVTDKIPKL